MERSTREEYRHGPPPPQQPQQPQQQQQTQQHSLPPINHQLAPMSDAPRMSEPRREEAKEVIEPAARKVEEDDEYDADETEDVKREPGVSRHKENSSPSSKGVNGTQIKTQQE